MKSRIRATSPPAKVFAVSDETLARARAALQAFGLAPVDLDRLTNFKGDLTIGPTTKDLAVRPAVKPFKSPLKPARDDRSRTKVPKG
jgi:hypothetical protein